MNNDIHTIEKLLNMVHKYTGITMTINKQTLLEGRLRARLKTLNLINLEEYLIYLESHKNEIQEFVNLVTTNETSFFRTQRIWSFFYEEFLTSWYNINKKNILKIWSAAVSSGEEIYSIAMMCEEFKQKNSDFNYQIIGTDISQNVINKAIKGEYSGRTIEIFKKNNPLFFEKYMQEFNGIYKVIPVLKQKIQFSLHNLFQLPIQQSYFNIVFLRNVLIYFNTADQEKVLMNVSKSLLDNSILIIGESESLNSLNIPFQYKLPFIYDFKKVV